MSVLPTTALGYTLGLRRDKNIYGRGETSGKLLSGTMQLDAKKQVIPFKPRKKEYKYIYIYIS